ncbi:hypothetical protein DPMN_038491 [Dreissena polymorpha]|uniref:Uncharacterized protein n=1 Tax=Dreissena polymorpha TaxID=45954 RepID=A0A9D4MER1_DREPO|nr:hypothetical protein DPMN_038491 [Dreissena polymorpha]
MNAAAMITCITTTIPLSITNIHFTSIINNNNNSSNNSNRNSSNSNITADCRNYSPCEKTRNLISHISVWNPR